jgi:hypothetical protein
MSSDGGWGAYLLISFPPSPPFPLLLTSIPSYLGSWASGHLCLYVLGHSASAFVGPVPCCCLCSCCCPCLATLWSPAPHSCPCVLIPTVICVFVQPWCVYPAQLSANIFEFALTCFIVHCCTTSFI